MNSVPDITKTLASYLHDTSYSDIPENVLDQSKVLILDWFGAAISGSAEKLVDVLIEGIREVDAGPGKNQASVIAKGFRTSVLSAALINGAMSHALEIDDYHSLGIVHPCVTLLPAILAVAEPRRLSGKEVMTAFVLGFDVLIRICAAAGKAHYDRGWHTTSTIGRFGAAAGVGKLLNLSVNEMINSFGLAGTQAGGLQTGFGTMCKAFHAGKACMDGVLSAVLAKKGFTSPKQVIEGARGFLDTFSGNWVAEAIFADLGSVYHIMTTTIKPYASCGFTHAAIDVMREIRSKISINVDDVESIKIEVNRSALQVANNMEPSNGSEGKFSIQHCAAVALMEGSAGIDMFTEEMISNHKIAKLRRKIITSPRGENETLFGAKGSVKMKGGKEYVEEVHYPKGDPNNRLSYAEVVDKFCNACEGRITKQKSNELILRIEALNELEDVSLLFDLCSP